MFGTRAVSTACTMALDSGALRPSGFSHITILPAFAAAIAISAWVSLGLAMSIRSISGDATTLRQSLSTDSYPHLAANDFARSALRAHTVLSTGWYGTSKKWFTWPKALAWVRPMNP